MKNYPISDLKLSDGARNILAQLHITTTDELAGVVMARVSELCGDERNIFKEIDIIVWQLRKQKLIPAEYTPEQLQKMSHRSIDELSLDSKTNYFLKEYNHLYIDQVAQLTAEDYASLDGIGRVRIEEIQKAIKIWILNIMPPEEYQKAFFNPAVVRDGKIVPLYMCQVPLTASILDVMRRHPVKELRLTASAYDIAKDNDVETIGELAVLDYHEIVSKPYRPYRKRSIHDVLDNLFVWIDENMLSFHLVPDDVKDEVMYLHAMEGCARMLEPICKISSGKMYTLFHRDGKLELLDLRENEESTFYNYQLALSLDGLKKTFCSLWDTILPDNVDYTDRVELKLHEMNITGVTEFVDASLQKHYIFKIDNQYVLNIRRFLDAYCVENRFETIQSDILKMYMHGKSLEEIAAGLFFTTKESVKKTVKKEIKTIDRPFEYAYHEPFCYFAFEKDEFLSAFPEIDEQGYTYLCMRYRRGKHKLNSDNLALYTGYWKQRLITLYEKKAVV